MTTAKRWHGAVALLVDAVTHGSSAIEQVQKRAAAVPFSILERVPGIGPISGVVHVAHDACVTGVHGAIRLVAHGAREVADVAVDLAVAHAGRDESPP